MRIHTLTSIILASLVLAPAVAFAAFDVDLRHGARSSSVVELQQFLIARGHLQAGNDTGYFGALTLAAVKAFQAAHGVQPVSGFFGPLSRAAANVLGVAIPSDDATKAAKVAALLQQVQLIQARISEMKRISSIQDSPLTPVVVQRAQPASSSSRAAITPKPDGADICTPAVAAVPPFTLKTIPGTRYHAWSIRYFPLLQRAQRELSTAVRSRDSVPSPPKCGLRAQGLL